LTEHNCKTASADDPLGKCSKQQTLQRQSPSLLHFNGHFPGEPGLAGTGMSSFRIVLELRALACDGGGECWQLEL